MDTRELLRTARLERGWTQRVLAQQAGIGATTVAAYETGRRTPTLANLERLVELCGWELRMLLEPRRDRDGAAIARLAEVPPEQRVDWDLRPGWERARVGGYDVRWGGPAAAVAQGAPVGVPGLTVAVVEEELDTLWDVVEALGWRGSPDLHALREVGRLPVGDHPQRLEIVLLGEMPRERQLVSDGMRVRLVALEDLDERAVDPTLRSRVVNTGALADWPRRPPARAGGPRPEGRFDWRREPHYPEGPFLGDPAPPRQR